MVDIKKIRKSICQTAEYLINKDLTDLSGGNISVRDKNRIYINERLSGPNYQWKIEEDSIIVTDICKIPVIGDDDLITREASTHYLIYQTFPEINAIIHCHPLFMMVFGAAHMDIPSVTEGSRVILGDQPITNIEESIPSSQDQAEKVVDNFKRRRLKDPNAALICNIPFHGMFTAGQNLNDALVYADIANNCAKLLIYRQLMFGNDPSADLSIRKHFTREDFSTMDIFKEVCKPGYVYEDTSGQRTIYSSPGLIEKSPNQIKSQIPVNSISINKDKIVSIVTEVLLKLLSSK